MKHIDSTEKVGWLSLDAWSETYLGAHWIIKNKLPEKPNQAEAVDGALSQMVLIASHQLVEIMLFGCIRSNLKQSGQLNEVLDEVLKRLSFNEAFNKWPKLLMGEPFPKKTQPFKAARVLAARRNATVHSESALTTLEMARSALYTGVMASRAVQTHFESGPFYYEAALAKYPVEERVWFSEDMYP